MYQHNCDKSGKASMVLEMNDDLGTNICVLCGDEVDASDE